MRLVFTAQARSDLLRIGDHIAADSPARAISFVYELRNPCAALQAAPRAWPLIPRYESRGVRRLVHGAYLIFYRVDAETVTILHVLHGAMDYEAMFPGG